MDREFKNVSDMIKELSTGQEFKDDSLKLLRKKKLSKYLFFLRCESNFTQMELAEKLGCSQGRISKLENTHDESLSVKDLLDYAKALDLQLEVGFRKKSVKLTDLIKYHVFKIDNCLRRLTSLAKEKQDKAIVEGVTKFCIEALANISNLILNSLVDLKKIEQRTQGRTVDLIHISPPIDENLLKKENLIESKE
ncbi:MAG: helix-turn-helix transcriptional regulator [Candidatus Omnitrophica bacterium]|nr:helix-turn-helix transcriptional regulator [Candidatus Omnitrophota bacterium]